MYLYIGEQLYWNLFHDNKNDNTEFNNTLTNPSVTSLHDITLYEDDRNRGYCKLLTLCTDLFSFKLP